MRAVFKTFQNRVQTALRKKDREFSVPVLKNYV